MQNEIVCHNGRCRHKEKTEIEKFKELCDEDELCNIETELLEKEIENTYGR